MSGSRRLAAGSTTREVHVLPVGWEFDRAVLPFETRGGTPPTYHAHEFHVISEGPEAGMHFPERVADRLQAIAPTRIHSVQRDDPVSGEIIEFEQIVDVASRLCARAIENGDRVHINLSSGSKLIAFAAGVVAMAHIRPATGSVYYVRPERYSKSPEEFNEHGFAIGVRRIQEVAIVPLRLPEPPQLRVLSFLKHQHALEVRYRDVLEYLREIPASGYQSKRTRGADTRRHENADVTRMVRTIISPLAQQNLVRVNRDGVAKTVELLPNGRLYASLSAIDQPGLRKPLRW